MSIEDRNKTLRRIALYMLGIIILGFGIDLNTKAGLGVSPVISVAYNIAMIIKAPIGAATFVYYCFLILLQFILLKGKLPAFQALQIAASFLTSLFIQIFDTVLPVPADMLLKIVTLLIAIFFTGLGASITVAMQIVPNPADGLARVVAEKLGRDLGFGKNVLDAICITVAIIIGLAFKHSLLGIGIGTVLSVILTGRVMALTHPYFDRLS